MERDSIFSFLVPIWSVWLSDIFLKAIEIEETKVKAMNGHQTLDLQFQYHVDNHLL